MEEFTKELLHDIKEEVLLQDFNSKLNQLAQSFGGNDTY